MQYISINTSEVARYHYTIMHTASEVMPDDGLWNRNMQNWLTNIKVLCFTVIICLYLEKSNPPSGTPQFHYFHSSLEDHAIGSHETDFGGNTTSSKGTAINTTSVHCRHLSGYVCSPMPASDLMEKIQLQKRTSILNIYVILGTVHNFGIFFL